MGSMDGPVTRLRLRVSPGAGRSTVVGRHGDGWKVRVAAAPERGRANDELVGLLSSTLGVARGRVQLVSGATGRAKVVELSGVAPEEIDRRLEAAGRKE
jgi:uncharacterized protein (TIGR00251 family)